MHVVRSARRTLTALTLVATLGLTVACTPDGAEPPQPKASASTGPIKLTLAVYGPASVISAYTTIASRFSATNPGITVNVKPYASHDAAMADLARTRGTDRAPDLYLASRDDLPTLMDSKANQRVDDMLSQQNVDFGDGYERAGLEAFSADSALQCMPVDLSPQVVYYNRRLIDLSTLRPNTSRQPTPEGGWRFSDFTAAAEEASQARGNKGVFVAPTIDQIAPFVFSGGGDVVDDTESPTALTLGEGASPDAMQKLLTLLRDPDLTFTPAQIAKQSALSRFKTGHLGMIVGNRSLTPQLRQQDGLSFGVMPMPRVGRTATTIDASGLCVRPRLPHRTSTARFLAYLVSDASARVLAKTGYVVPANARVLVSDDFNQPALQPSGAEVFSNVIRYSRDLPAGKEWDEARTVLDAQLSTLLIAPSIDPLDQRLQQVDQIVSQVLSNNPSGSPSGTPSGSPGGSPSGRASVGSASPSGSGPTKSGSPAR